MTRGAYYNEFDSGAAAWLRELIKAGQIAAGDVDERSIEDVQPDDLRGYTQCHVFAGIGGWSLALRRAGFDDTRPVWTGSCPCQPFSTAGAGKGFADERHLWPAFFHLIEQCRPSAVFGEQVAGPDGLVWLDLVQADLEAAGYAVGAADLCAAGVGAPHIRQRLYWVAHANGARLEGGNAGAMGHQRAASQRGCGSGGLADVHGSGCAPGREGLQAVVHGSAAGANRGAGWMGDADRNRAWRDRGAVHSQIKAVDGKQRADDAGAPSGDLRPGPLHGYWRDADWLGCRDGKWRPVEPGTFPLAHGLPRGLVRGGDQRLAPNSSAEGRVVRLRGYGNAIVPQVAEAFIRASGVIA